VEIGMAAGIAFDSSGAARAGMGIDWADFKNDGSLGLAIGNFANEMMALYVSDDPARLRFADLAAAYGLGAATQPPMKFGLIFFDYDLDGRLDLLSANGHLDSDIGRVQSSQTYTQSAQLFWNSGRPGRDRFLNVGPHAAGPDLFRPIVGRGATYADIDGDGDLDVLLTANGSPARLFRNESGADNHWLRLHLKGRTSNRDALGSRVTVRAGGLEQHRQLFPARSYLSSVELPLTFGLGAATTAEAVRIVWPSGKTSVLSNLEAGKTHEVEEPVAEAKKGSL
jgi:enediyne biosynthesis protein E4